MIYFLDSSALIKRYVREQGSPWVQTITDTKIRNSLMMARITWVEMLSGLTRRQREGNLPATELTMMLHNFRYDWDIQYRIVELDEALTQVAGQLVQKYPLRAYNSVQLATALKLRSVVMRFTNIQFTFVSADQRLLAVAQMEGLPIENPNDYP